MRMVVKRSEQTRGDRILVNFPSLSQESETSQASVMCDRVLSDWLTGSLKRIHTKIGMRGVGPNRQSYDTSTTLQRTTPSLGTTTFFRFSTPSVKV